MSNKPTKHKQCLFLSSDEEEEIPFNKPKYKECIICEGFIPFNELKYHKGSKKCRMFQALTGSTGYHR